MKQVILKQMQKCGMQLADDSVSSIINPLEDNNISSFVSSHSILIPQPFSQHNIPHAKIKVKSLTRRVINKENINTNKKRRRNTIQKQLSENVNDADIEAIIPAIKMTLKMKCQRDQCIKYDALNCKCIPYQVPISKCRKSAEWHSRSKSCLDIRKSTSIHHMPSQTEKPFLIQDMKGNNSNNRGLQKRISCTFLPAKKREGMLSKSSSGILQSWKEKYCVLENKSFLYYDKKGDCKLKGCIDFNRINCQIVIENCDAPKKFE